MPGLAGRMSTVIKAKISKMLDRAEDPAETLEYSYQKQTELLQNVKKGIADVVTSKKRLQLQQQKLEQQVVKLDTQARQALAAGNEPLARTALERKQFAQTELQSLDQQVAELEQQQAGLIEKERVMRSKIEQFRTKKEVIKAQYSAAEAQVKISEAATGVGEEMADVGLAMQRAMDKTENMRARAGAMEELEAAGAFDDNLMLRRRRRRHRPPAARADVAERGRRRPGEDEGRAGLGAAPPASWARARPRAPSSRSEQPSRAGAPGVIVRIATEGQYRLPDDAADQLNELDNEAVAAVEADDEDRFHATFEQMLELVRREGQPLDDDELEELRRDPAAARSQLRRGGGRVHGRGADPD